MPARSRKSTTTTSDAPRERASATFARSRTSPRTRTPLCLNSGTTRPANWPAAPTANTNGFPVVVMQPPFEGRALLGTHVRVAETRHSECPQANASCLDAPFPHWNAVLRSHSLASRTQHLMNELNADGSLADRRCDPLHAPRANVPHSKDPRTACLEEKRRSGDRVSPVSLTNKLDGCLRHGNGRAELLRLHHRARSRDLFQSRDNRSD